MEGQSTNIANNKLSILVEDNGIGLPANKERLTEPYVTARDKGTGLGLAIVRKIMEDHHGRFVLSDRPEGGARVSMIFENMSAFSEEKNENRSVRSKT